MTATKLYKRVGRELLYHEARASDGGIVEHWGTVGETGETKDHPIPRGLDDDVALEGILASARRRGFVEFDDDEMRVVLVEYAIDGMGSTQDLDKRHALEERLDETLGWTGLGHCDGGSIGSGTMEVCCYVVDFETARRVIAADLVDTPFENYTRIFDESDD